MVPQMFLIGSSNLVMKDKRVHAGLSLLQI